MNRKHGVAALRILLVALCLAALVFVFRQLAPANPTSVAVSLLLFILILAARWGLWYAVATSVAAAACFNFFFLPPVGTFTIADPQNWVALFSFLGAAIIASHLSSRIKREARQAQAREQEVAMLLELSRALLQTDRVIELLPAIPEIVAGATQTESVILYLDRSEQLFQTAAAESQDLKTITPRAAIHLTEVRTHADSGWTMLPIRTGLRPRGVMLIHELSASLETCESMARLVSIAIDRAEALEEAARSEAAKESERLRMVLLDSVTHELKTPLTAIKASASALLSTSSITPENRIELLTVINEESDRLDRLIVQALQMGQLESGILPMHFSSQSIHKLVENAVEATAQALRQHTLVTHIPERMPKVFADAEWIERTLANLIENAAKYSPRSSSIEVSAAAGEEYVSISVIDQGAGIDLQEREMIFERFYRGQQIQGSIPGTGMGLAICRAILHAHHGEISVRNEPTRGACFTITLPVAALAE